MRRYLLIIALFGLSNYVLAQIREEPIMLRTKDCDIQGTLTLPEDGYTRTVVLIVAGTGPIDRDCNQTLLRTNSYKMYAHVLAQNNIASVRYDKRGVAASKIRDFDQSKLRLSMFVDDVKGWVDLLKNERRFSRVIIAGHNEGSLLGLTAISEGCKADAIISIAGMGRRFDVIMKEQLAVLPEQVRDIAYDIIDTLSMGKTVENIPVYLRNNFTQSLQPFLISMMNYNPQDVIRDVRVPILIIHGDMDMQIKSEDAKRLAAANKSAKLLIINGMNHVMKDCPSMDREIQTETYINPAYPLTKQFLDESIKFIRTVAP